MLRSSSRLHLLNTLQPASKFNTLFQQIVGRNGIPRCSSLHASRQLSIQVDVKSIPMPSLSPTMTQGIISSWKKSPGESLVPGEILCDIETDKATVGYEMQDEGVLAKILVEAGTNELKCGEPIALIVEDIEAYQSFLKSGGDISVPNTASNPAVTLPEPPIQVISKGTNSNILSPAARHLVDSKNLDIKDLQGTARGGRVTKADVILGIKNGSIKSTEKTTITSFLEVSSSAPVASNVPLSNTPVDLVANVVKPSTTTSAISPISIKLSSDSFPKEKYTDIPNNRMRSVIAKRLTESKTTVPHSYYTSQINIDALLQLRIKLKEELKVSVSVNDIVIKATALALRDIPEAAGSWAGKPPSWNKNSSVDISVAVATPNGLITPIVTGADKRGLANINAQVRDLATRAKDNKLKPEEFQGGAFTISNLGMFGISEFSAVINAPQGCILAVGSGVSRVVPNTTSTATSKLRLATTLSVTLSADQRVLDEAMAGVFMQLLQGYLSNPNALLI